MKKILLSTVALVFLSAPVFAQSAPKAPKDVLDLTCWHMSLPIDHKGTGKATSL